SMHEHVCDELVRLEIIRGEKMKSEYPNQIYMHRALKNISSREHEPINDEQVFYNRWQNIELRRAVLIHGVKLVEDDKMQREYRIVKLVMVLTDWKLLNDPAISPSQKDS